MLFTMVQFGCHDRWLGRMGLGRVNAWCVIGNVQRKCGHSFNMWFEQDMLRTFWFADVVHLPEVSWRDVPLLERVHWFSLGHPHTILFHYIPCSAQIQTLFQLGQYIEQTQHVHISQRFPEPSSHRTLCH